MQQKLVSCVRYHQSKTNFASLSIFISHVSQVESFHDRKQHGTRYLITLERVVYSLSKK